MLSEIPRSYSSLQSLCRTWVTIKVRLEGFLLCVSMCVSACGLHLYFGGLWAPLWICSLAASGLYVLHLTCTLQTHRLNALLDTQNYVCVFRSFWLNMCQCMQYYNKNPKVKLLSSIPFEAIPFHYFHRQECIWMQNHTCMHFPHMETVKHDDILFG